MIHASGPGVVTAASSAARSAFVCAAVVPVLVTAVAPFVMAAGLVFATSVTVFVKSCASRNAPTPVVVV
jgi:hypothetical protein